MFISDDEYLIGGTDLGYISAKRVDGVWAISLPPKHRNDPRLLEKAEAYADILADLEAGIVPYEPREVTGNIQNMAAGQPLERVVRRMEAKIEARREKPAKEKDKQNDNRRARIY